MIYKFRVISEEEEDFFRDIEIKSDQTFLDLHNAIQDAVGYDKSQMASFFLSDDAWDKGMEISLINMTDEEEDMQIIYSMDVTIISDFVTNKDINLIYVFDFFSERDFHIELVEKSDEEGLTTYPVCTETYGDAPEQIKIVDVNLDDILDSGVSDSYSEDINSDDEDIFENLDDYEDLV